MHPFVETISVAGAVVIVIVAAIIVLALFFRGISLISDAGTRPEAMAIRGVLRKGTFATVHLMGGETFERVQVIGFTNAFAMKAQIPHELHGMVILEDERGTRFLVRAKSIRLIVVEPKNKKE